METHKILRSVRAGISRRTSGGACDASYQTHSSLGRLYNAAFEPGGGRFRFELDRVRGGEHASPLGWCRNSAVFRTIHAPVPSKPPFVQRHEPALSKPTNFLSVGSANRARPAAWPANGSKPTAPAGADHDRQRVRHGPQQTARNHFNDLTKDDFKITEDGVEQKVEFFSRGSEHAHHARAC
jgi:hypothetical protein